MPTLLDVDRLHVVTLYKTPKVSKTFGVSRYTKAAANPTVSVDLGVGGGTMITAPKPLGAYAIYIGTHQPPRTSFYILRRAG